MKAQCSKTIECSYSGDERETHIINNYGKKEERSQLIELTPDTG
jgi:hypothetical protein